MPVRTEVDTVKGRLATFRKARVNGKAVKWPHRRLPMVGMARAFFYYDPTPQAADCVVCACCGERFADWSLACEKPILRHAEGSHECVFAQLARMAIALKGNAPQLSYKQLVEGFEASFRVTAIALSQETVQQLSSRGFMFLAEAPSNRETVGCVLCNCFPQSAVGSPQHSANCVIPVALAAALAVSDAAGSVARKSTQAHLRAEAEDAVPANTTIECTPTTQAEENPKEPTKDSLAVATRSQAKKPEANTAAAVAHAGRTDARTPAVSYKASQELLGEEASVTEAKNGLAEAGDVGRPVPCTSGRAHETADAAEQALRRCCDLFGQLQLDGEKRRVQLEAQAVKEKLTPAQLVSHMEGLAMALLEETHARRIQLIQQETERIVTQLLEAKD